MCSCCLSHRQRGLSLQKLKHRGQAPRGRRGNTSLGLTCEALVRESARPPGIERGDLLREIREFHPSQVWALKMEQCPLKVSWRSHHCRKETKQDTKSVRQILLLTFAVEERPWCTLSSSPWKPKAGGLLNTGVS